MTALIAHMSHGLLAAALGALAGLLPLTAAAAQGSNPWAPGTAGIQAPSGPPVVQPTPDPVAKPKYYQEPPQAAPAPIDGSIAPDRFAPADLDQRLSTGLPLEMQIPSAGYSGVPQAATPLAGPLPTPGQLPGAVYGGLPAPGYGPAIAPYGLGNGYGGYPALPGYGTALPLGTLGYPGNYGGYWPSPGGLTSGAPQGFGFPSGGFW